MKLEWASIQRPKIPETLEGIQQEDPIDSIDVTGMEPTDVAARVAWKVVKEGEDHPEIGVLAILVAPDGIWTLLGGGGSSSWGNDVHRTAIQVARFPYDGAYTIEIRPYLPKDNAMPSSSGDARLAVLPLEVTGTKSPLSP